jgi:biopolymer transport protein TolR
MLPYRNRRRRPMSDINVVPYIDVMLVLLVIFMVTAPLIKEGVKVDLPHAGARPLPEQRSQPVVVTVDAAGAYYVKVGTQPDQAVDAGTLVARVAAQLRRDPASAVVVRGDAGVAYGRVVTAMALLQKAGAPSVGLMTEPLPTALPR